MKKQETENAQKLANAKDSKIDTHKWDNTQYTATGYNPPLGSLLIVEPTKPRNPPAYAYDISPYANLTMLKSYTPHDPSSRVFVMGDVHGCLDEMNQLLEKIGFEQHKDILVMVGDLIHRGPDSIGVVKRAKELNALCVRGNHEDKLIRLKTYELQHGIEAMGPPKSVVPEGNVVDPMKFKNKHNVIAKVLEWDDYEYLVGCPLILDIPMHNARIVHGGVDPALDDIFDNDPWSVMNMRDIDGNNQPTKEKILTQNEDSESIGSEGSIGIKEWTEVYAKSDNKDNDLVVYYGHDASKGLVIKENSVGLDTGCVHSRSLTVIELNTKTVTQVDCPGHEKEDKKKKKKKE
ncbi:Metallo-dependent phosphatase-like protein [Pilobolus umbonatus]|nr:Metallo-dependent phosphatase-like protein [Pilobolus umbonatus]